jgi:hypothetical protein
MPGPDLASHSNLVSPFISFFSVCFPPPFLTQKVEPKVQGNPQQLRKQHCGSAIYKVFIMMGYNLGYKFFFLLHFTLFNSVNQNLSLQGFYADLLRLGSFNETAKFLLTKNSFYAVSLLPAIVYTTN